MPLPHPLPPCVHKEKDPGPRDLKHRIGASRRPFPLLQPSSFSSWRFPLVTEQERKVVLGSRKGISNHLKPGEVLGSDLSSESGFRPTNLLSRSSGREGKEVRGTDPSSVRISYILRTKSSASK